MQAQLCPYQASLSSTFLCKRGPVLSLFAVFPPPVYVGGRVGAWECELDPALISQAANCYCSLDTKHNSFLEWTSSVILHITQLLCSAVQLIGKGNAKDCLRFIKLKRDSNEQTHTWNPVHNYFRNWTFVSNALQLLELVWISYTITSTLSLSCTTLKGSLKKNRRTLVKIWLLTGEASQYFSRSLN